ncbi:hypothetical protein AOLI_G00165570 [Acnodon oligacanthus]
MCGISQYGEVVTSGAPYYCKIFWRRPEEASVDHESSCFRFYRCKKAQSPTESGDVQNSPSRALLSRSKPSSEHIQAVTASELSRADPIRSGGSQECLRRKASRCADRLTARRTVEGLHDANTYVCKL